MNSLAPRFFSSIARKNGFFHRKTPPNSIQDMTCPVKTCDAVAACSGCSQALHGRSRAVRGAAPTCSQETDRARATSFGFAASTASRREGANAGTGRRTRRSSRQALECDRERGSQRHVLIPRSNSGRIQSIARGFLRGEPRTSPIVARQTPRLTPSDLSCSYGPGGPRNRDPSSKVNGGFHNASTHVSGTTSGSVALKTSCTGSFCLIDKE